MKGLRPLIAGLLTALAASACSDNTAPVVQGPADQPPVASALSPHFLNWDLLNGPATFDASGDLAERMIAFSSVGPAAIAVDNSSSATDSEEWLTWSHTVGGGANRLLVVSASIRNGGKYVTDVTYGNQPLSYLGARNNHDDAVRVEIWYLVGPASGTSDITINLSDGAKIVGGAMSFTGVDPTSPVGSFVFNGSDKADGNTNEDDPRVTISSATGQFVIAAIATEGAAQTFSADAPQTDRWDLFYGLSGGDVGGAGSTAPGGSTSTMSWTKEKKAKWAIGAVALNAAPGTTVNPYDASFWAVRGQKRGVQINYQGQPFVQFQVTDPTQRPDGSSIAVGDSVLITVSVDPMSLVVQMEPSGLQFGTAAELQIWYGPANHDFNGDGVIDGNDSYIQSNLLGMWYQATPLAPWTYFPAAHDVTEQRFVGFLEHFSGYAVAY